MTPLLAFGMPSGSELFFIMIIVLVLFGAKRLPELARGLGQSLGEFKKAKDEFEREIHKASNEQESTPVVSKELPSQGNSPQDPPKAS